MLCSQRKNTLYPRYLSAVVCYIFILLGLVFLSLPVRASTNNTYTARLSNVGATNGATIIGSFTYVDQGNGSYNVTGGTITLVASDGFTENFITSGASIGPGGVGFNGTNIDPYTSGQDTLFLAPTSALNIVGTVGLYTNYAIPNSGSGVRYFDPSTKTEYTVAITGSLIVTTGTPAPLVITTTSLPDATSGKPYSQGLIATGGQGSISWSLKSGSSLPSGFALSSGGTLSSTGQPAATSGTYQFTVVATDSAGTTAQQGLSLTVDSNTVNPVNPLVITTTSLPDAQSGSPYNFQFTATGGQGTTTWTGTAATGSSLPAGFTLSSNGVLGSSGNPAAIPGPYILNIVATDSTGATATGQFTLTVDGVTNISLDVPTFTTNPDGSHVLTQCVYVKGTGSATISGHWITRSNQTLSPVNQITVDLSSGDWVKLDSSDISIDYGGAGYDTVQFQVDNPSTTPVTATAVEQIAITGLVPSQTLWSLRKIPNMASYYTDANGKQINGLCEGFTQTARDYYDGIVDPLAPSLPPIGSSFKTYDPYWLRFFQNGYQWLSAHDYGRIKTALSYPLGRQYYVDTLFSEAGLIRARLTSGDPCVIDCFPFLTTTPANDTAHSVLGTASVYSPDVYDNQNDVFDYTMQIFSIYDPNNFGDNTRFLEAFDTGSNSPVMQFVPSVPAYSSYVMWMDNTYPGKE